MKNATISSLGVALPDSELTNAELAERFGVSADWIFERTGIESRRIAGPNDTAESLGAEAAERALDAAALRGQDLDLIICATITATRRFPATGCLIGAALGSAAPAFDLNAGCSGFLFALAQAGAAVSAGIAHRVLVVGSEVMSRIVDRDDVKTSILFGDGGAAAIVEPTTANGMVRFALSSDGRTPEFLSTDVRGLVAMEGREIYRAAVTSMTASVRSIAGSSLAEVDLLVPHQANQRIIDAVVQRLGIDEGRAFSNIARYGNTSAASIPLALYEAVKHGRLVAGDRVVLTAFGAGYCWGAGVIDWTPVSIAPGVPAQEVAGV